MFAILKLANHKFENENTALQTQYATQEINDEEAENIAASLSMLTSMSARGFLVSGVRYRS